MGLLTGKTALITGATRGIGKAIAIRFASEGANLAITNQSSQEAAELFAEELRNTYGVKVVAFTSDASDFEKAHEVVTTAHKELGRIDILVNNAGITRDTLIMRMLPYVK